MSLANHASSSLPASTQQSQHFFQIGGVANGAALIACASLVGSGSDPDRTLTALTLPMAAFFLGLAASGASAYFLQRAYAATSQLVTLSVFAEDATHTLRQATSQLLQPQPNMEFFREFMGEGAKEHAAHIYRCHLEEVQRCHAASEAARTRLYEQQPALAERSQTSVFLGTLSLGVSLVTFATGALVLIAGHAMGWMSLH